MRGREMAESYDASVAPRFDPHDVDPTVAVLAELAGDGRALGFAIGMGRIALHRRADWSRSEFAADSPTHVSVWRRTSADAGHGSS